MVAWKYTMLRSAQIDIPLLVLLVLLLATLTAFLVGVFPYPFGFIILGFACILRLSQLKKKKS